MPRRRILSSRAARSERSSSHSTRYERNLEASLSLFGETGGIVLGGPAANDIALWNVRGHARPRRACRRRAQRVRRRLRRLSTNHGAIYANVAAHLLGGTEPIAVTAASAARSIAVIEAIYESARVGRSVAVREGDTA